MKNNIHKINKIRVNLICSINEQKINFTLVQFQNKPATVDINFAPSAIIWQTRPNMFSDV